MHKKIQDLHFIFLLEYLDLIFGKNVYSERFWTTTLIPKAEKYFNF